MSKSFQSSRNGYSSDALGGFPCYADVALETYLNQPDVRRAIHINGRKKWTSSAPDVSKRYTRDNHEMHPFFDWIVSNLTDLHRELVVVDELEEIRSSR